MSTTVEPFSVPEQLTDPALVFFYTTEQARSFVAEYFRTVQANDALMYEVALNKILTDNGEGFRAFVEQDRAGIEEETRHKGITSEDLDRALHDPAMAALVVVRGSRNALDVVRDHGYFLLQMVLGRMYAAFQIYLVDLLIAILQVSPPSTQELGQQTLEKYVYNLSWKKEQLYKDVYRKRLNLPLFNDVVERNREVLIAETRHIIEHNRGRISQRFVNLVHNFTAYTNADVGRTIKLNVEQVADDLSFLHNKVKDIDARAIAQFGLSTITISQTETVETAAAVPALATGADQAEPGGESDEAPTPTARIGD